MQAEAAARPESKQVQTPAGPVWMSPIEAQLYQAMLQERLDPVPQFYIQGYYADFAFPDVGIAVEADGAVHQDPARHQHDRKRDWILRRAGWTVMRFHGTTIYHKASNCAYVIKKEVEGRRMQAALRAKEAGLAAARKLDPAGTDVLFHQLDVSDSKSIAALLQEMSGLAPRLDVL